MLRQLTRHLQGGISTHPSAADGAFWEYGGDVGVERFEFGQKEWCEICVAHGCKLLTTAAEAGKLDLSAHEWGFSEEYCQCPERLAESFDAGRSVYWFMIKDGKVLGGTSVRDPGWADCLTLRGFHIAAQWGLIAHASGMLYGAEGMPQRNKDTALLEENLLVECRPPPSSFLATLATKPQRVAMSEAFPAEIGQALSGKETGLEGLHNAGALIMKKSPEVASLPMSRIGIPALHKMDDAQKEQFYHLLQRPLRPVYGSDLRQTGAFGMPGAMAAENEFGDRPWCQACAEHGVKLINMAVAAGELDLSKFEWAFSEEYTEAPARCLGGRRISCYWIAISGGVASCGWENLPGWVMALKGFHITASWAQLAGPSGAIYGTVGSALRSHHAGILQQQLDACGKGKPPQATIDGCHQKKPKDHAPFFPTEIGMAMRDRPSLAGLHNFAAYTGGRVPPELEGLPLTTSYVVDLERCTDLQREQFFAALGRNPGHAANIPSQYL